MWYNTQTERLPIDKQARNETTTSWVTPSHPPHHLHPTQYPSHTNLPDKSFPFLVAAMPVILVVGATRGLGASLVKLYASDPNNDVYATSRTSQPPANGAFETFAVALVYTNCDKASA